VLGYLVVAGLATAVILLVTRRDDPVPRDPNYSVGDQAARFVTPTGGLAGFTVTALVLIVTLGQTMPDTSGIEYTTLLTLIVTAYFSFLAVSVLYANIAEVEKASGFDVPSAQFVGASIQLTFSVFLAWTALIPLFGIFGLVQIQQITGWLLLVNLTLGGYAIMSVGLYRSGFFSRRQIVLMPALAVAGSVAYLVVSRSLGLGSPDTTLNLAVVAAFVGTFFFGIVCSLSVIARHSRLGLLLRSKGRWGVVLYAQGAVVFIGFLLMAALKLI
jgi:hypothetical protein